MKSRILMCITATTLFAALAIAVRVRLAAQEQPAVQGQKAQHTRYQLIDMGTFGGPASYLTDPGNGPGFLVLNNAGVLVGRADTSTYDPTFGGFLAHAFRWQKGVLTDLGTPAGGVFSGANGINARGWIAIDFSTGEIDPLNGGAIFRGPLWKDGQFVDLGTLGGLETDALYVNNAGQLVGFSTVNTIPDPFSFLGASIHPFIWQDGVMRDLGTLGGPDAGVGGSCEEPRNGLVSGASLIDSTPNPDTGIPTSHPFLWENGQMTDLGTLGGTLTGLDVGAGTQCVNNRGQVAGASFLAGNSIVHPFLWDHGVLTDLGTLGGDNGVVEWLNDAGEIVGYADLPGSENHHAFLWKNGVMTDLGTLGSTSAAFAINSKGQVVGRSRLGAPTTPLQHAFLWENGGPMVDLNTLIPPNSPLELYDGENINDRGEIAGRGLPPGCDDKDVCGHAFLLIPCDPADAQGCEDGAESTAAMTQNNSAPVTNGLTTSTQSRPTPSEMVAAWRARLAQRYHFPGTLARPAD